LTGEQKVACLYFHASQASLGGINTHAFIAFLRVYPACFHYRLLLYHVLKVQVHNEVQAGNGYHRNVTSFVFPISSAKGKLNTVVSR
jgi:hypothetical protein